MITGFQAVAVDELGRQYDASFFVQAVRGGFSQQDLQEAVDGAVRQFYEYHPNGRIIRRVMR